ncbi:MAG: hypothetical protein H6502_00850 [Candidatus Woesearchaeota archaeon]|nr:MAG: hypothetical protein H6502_00850 [Candidatus Woesearchaeota archaeon]
MKRQLFLPTVAEFSKDIATSMALQQPLVDIGYTPGLCIVMRGGMKAVTDPEIIAKQQQNLVAEVGDTYEAADVITMLSNIPIGEIDFLHNTKQAVDHVKAGIDFARALPIGGERYVTFHLNTLVRKGVKDMIDLPSWRGIFRTNVAPALQEIARYARNQGVRVNVETTPAPEFGDIPRSKELSYLGVHASDLRNPFLLTEANGGFGAIRAQGLGICLDLCHNRTLYDLAAQGDEENVLGEERTYFEKGSLATDVSALEPGDLAHVNDGKGTYAERDGTLFEEGVALGQGDIEGLDTHLQNILAAEIPFVVEINETDFATRPNTRASIDYLARLG